MTLTMRIKHGRRHQLIEPGNPFRGGRGVIVGPAYRQRSTPRARCDKVSVTCWDTRTTAVSAPEFTRRSHASR
jgi:hypothetical protein